MSYDSTADTLKHIRMVNEELTIFAKELLDRGLKHDESKLHSPEKELFDQETPLLNTLVYGSKEYTESTRRLKPALDHHYANNSHHPQHYENKIDGMNLFDIVEMYCDWKAAVKRTKDGDINKSIEINKTRFKMSDQLVNIFKNTILQEEKNKIK